MTHTRLCFAHSVISYLSMFQVAVNELMSLASIDTLGRPRRKGSTSAQLFDAFLKLSFLKILLVDIGISLGDTVTDFLQGINLILDFNDGTLLEDN